MKKLRNLILFLILIFCIFLFFFFYPHHYKLEYEIDNFNIIEEYHKKAKYYSFKIKYEDNTYEVINKSKYTNKRKLIKDITVNESNLGHCLSFDTTHVNLYNVCKNDKEYFYETKDNKFNKNDSYKNIEIGNLFNKTYLLWNYHEFIYLNNKKKTTISLFNKDIYNLNLITSINNFLLVPDYDQNYKFDKIYMINSNNAKVKTFDLRYELYFDSYFLGNYKNRSYLYDQKQEQVFYLDLKKNEIYKAGYKILANGKWETITNQKLKNNKLTFTNEEIFTYFIKNNKLYGKYENEYLVTDNVSKIIKTEDMDVYYIKKDTLYHFNPYSGETPLLKYSEWNFNNTNMIFIF